MWQWHPLPCQVCGRPGWLGLQAAQSAHRCRSVQFLQLCWWKTSCVQVSFSPPYPLSGSSLLKNAASIVFQAHVMHIVQHASRSVGYRGRACLHKLPRQLSDSTLLTDIYHLSCLWRFSGFPGNHWCTRLSCSCLAAGLIQPSLLDDGQVCVDMGEPILEAERIPTTLAPTQARPCIAIGLLMS